METVLIKLSGELFKTENLDITKSIVCQLKKLKKKYNIAIVLGAGNIFRGNQQGPILNLQKTTAHNAGMLATIINGLIFKDMLTKEKIDSALFSAIYCPQITQVIQQDLINIEIQNNNILIFVGGTGNPFFTTDTNAVLRGLQINATQIWKGTKVNGVYSQDPIKNKKAKLIKKITYQDFINKNLQAMDITAITLAQENNIKIRVFNIFEKDALIKADQNKDFGSQIC